MSYQRPQDPYIHSNASMYDERYQQEGYRDEPGQQGQQGQGGNYYGGDNNAYGDNAATQAAATYSYATPKKTTSKWLKFGVPVVAVVVIVGAVLGGVLGSRAASKDKDHHSSRSEVPGTSPITDSGTLTAAQQAAKNGGNNQLFYQRTDMYGNPLFVADQVDGSAPSTNGNKKWNCQDTFSGGSLTNLRPHPRIIAGQYEWDCLADKIKNDAYLTLWNQTIFHNATAFYSMDPTKYVADGGFTGSGILDVSREVQMRVKSWAYAYKMSKDTKWKDRLYHELNVAAGHTDINFGQNGTHWNAVHFLDVAEMTAAFGIAYDWLYDSWNDTEKTMIRQAIIDYGLNPGLEQYKPGGPGWWTMPVNGNGNWNCVCNGGLLTGALAIYGDDSNSTQLATSIINSALQNMKDNCMRGVYSDGTWSETPNYWYFGTNAHGRALSALISATGSDQGLMDANPNFYKTVDFHMYVSGNGGMFAYGDNGPNKFGTTANQLMLYSKLSGNPRGALFQRDRADASFDPLSMFWYEPNTIGAFWNGLPLDQFFDNDQGGQWASMRSSWSNFNGLYVAIKASNATGHQTHGDLDAGDFVIDALGTRWAGEYGSGNYLSTGYFSSEDAQSPRWTYYRKATQGQNTLVINNQNQIPSCLPVNQLKSTNVSQNNDVDFAPAKTDAAYFITDTSSCYSLNAGSIRRGIRMLNGRRQVLVQDEIAQANGITSVQWRVQTNGTVTLSPDGRTATLTLSQITDPNAGVVGQMKFPKKTMVVKILSPDNVKFTLDGPPATRIYGQPDAQPPGEQGDQPNVGITALQMDVPTGQAQTVQVLWQPQWSDLSSADSVTPPTVALDQWSLTSHN